MLVIILIKRKQLKYNSKSSELCQIKICLILTVPI